MNKQYYVYILSNYNRTVLYIGITNNLCKRIWEHKQESISGFTKTYHVHDLLYYDVLFDPNSAIEREKQLKRWNRKKKDKLILQFNSNFKDLYSDICL